jgi:hypothetical protein
VNDAHRHCFEVSGQMIEPSFGANNGEPIGFVLYHVTKSPYDTFTAMHIIAMYMNAGHTAATDAMISFLKAVSPELGAQKIVGISRRKGWARRMKPDTVLNLGVWDV